MKTFRFMYLRDKSFRESLKLHYSILLIYELPQGPIMGKITSGTDDAAIRLCEEK